MLETSSFYNIPEELRNLHCWCVWRFEDDHGPKPTKVPYNANTFRLVDVTDPSGWMRFEDAIKAKLNGYEKAFHHNDDVRETGFSGIGFIFHESQNLTFIDLDHTKGDNVASERQANVYKEFGESYSDISPSGQGLHIIIKGKVPAGRRRSFIEIYSSGRYATMTGNIYPNTHTKPIIDFQDKLMMLWEQMGGVINNSIHDGNSPQLYSDEDITAKALAAINGEKFSILLSGNWQSLYASQSEADMAFIDILAFYTQNAEQITRMFRRSPLGQRAKAKRKDYMGWMISKSFDRILPSVDLDGFQNAIELKIANNVAGSPSGKATGFDPVIASSNLAPAATKRAFPRLEPSSSASFNYSPPPGLMGELARFIYDASPRQAPEIALAAAIGLMAGICGRAYNISGTGLNLYVLVLAKTGRGKEAAASGIDKLMNAIKLMVPTSTKFRGPGIINSGQALTKHLNQTSNCFVSILGEFGITIDRISNPFANSADKMLYSNLLDLYNKSGFGQTFQPSIYSKKEDNVGMTESPAVTILGESTFKLFYSALNEDMIAAGLLPRFLIIEYNGKREYLNENSHSVQPSFPLVEKLASLVANAESVMHHKKVVNVKTDDEATAMLRSIDRNSTDNINGAQDDVVAELWNRAHMKVLRISALIAVGVNPYDPIVTTEYVQWAFDLVQNDIKLLTNKFETGEIGKNSAEQQQIKETIRMIREYYTKPWSYISKYSKEEAMHTRRVIPLVYFSRRLVGIAIFSNGHMKASVAVNQALQTLCDRDILREVPKLQSRKDFNTEQKCFVLNDTDILASLNNGSLQ